MKATKKREAEVVKDPSRAMRAFWAGYRVRAEPDGETWKIACYVEGETAPVQVNDLTYATAGAAWVAAQEAFERQEQAEKAVTP